MKTPRIIQTTTLVLLLWTTAAAAEPAPSVLGHWITGTGNYEVDVAPCGQALCGTIVTVLDNRSMRDPSQPMTSPDPRPALGMRILNDLVPAGDAQWSGTVYDRESGKTYSCLVTALATGELKVRGYVGLTYFGRTAIWHRP